MFIFFFLQGCDRKTISSEEKNLVLDKFFRYLLFNESGIYTLVGSKPITDIWMFCEGKEEKIKRWESLSEEEKSSRILIINRDKKEDMDFYKTLSKKLRKKAVVVPDRDFLIDFECFVNNWGLIKKTNISNKYMLIGRGGFQKLKTKNEKFFRIVFVNVLQVALTLQEHYSLFKDFVGFDFDPISVVMELREDKSAFWDKLEEGESALLWGILYGFGKENSFCYLWKDKYKCLNEIEAFASQEFVSIPSLNNFSIPAFASFFEYDLVIQKYKKEKEIIQKEYQGKNFLDHTLKILSGNR